MADIAQIRGGISWRERCARPAAGVALLLGVGLGLCGQVQAQPVPQVSAMSAPQVRVVSLTECIAMALASNKTIRAAYLDRVAQKFDLRVAEDRFTPKLLLASALERSLSGSNGTTGAGVAGSQAVTSNSSFGSNTGSLSGVVNQALQTGGRLSLSASQALTRNTAPDNPRATGWSFALTQPLLKGGGISVGTASVVLARYAEQGNILALKLTLTDVLAQVITNYRAYYKAIQAHEISRESVARARELLEINRSLIASGRMAAIDIVQSEADVANQEFTLLTTEAAMDAARLALVQVLGVGTQTRLLPQESGELDADTYELPQAIELALQNRADFQAALLGVEVARNQLMLAENNLLPDLSLSMGYAQNRQASNLYGNGTAGNWNLGLLLTVPFGDLSFQQGRVQAQVNLDKAEVNLQRLRESLEIEVQNVLRTVATSLRQVHLARRARALTEKKVDIETEKLKVGRSSNFQLLSFQSDLVNALNSELAARISYLDAVSNLELTLGILLDKWGVGLVRR